MSLYLAQYNRNCKKVRLITKAWFSGYALAGVILPNARFDLSIDDRSKIDGSFVLTPNKETLEYIQDELLADVDRWIERATNWVLEIGFGNLNAHEDFIDRNWNASSVVLISDLDWFSENNIEIVL